MKLLSKIAILIGFIACISSCQKENIPVPTSSSQLNNLSNQRVSNSNSTQTDPSLIVGKRKVDTLDIVGGGDDDRDGGGDGKKVKKDR